MKPKTVPLYKLIYFIGPALLAAGLLIWLCGCTSAKMTFPDGRVFEYHRTFFDQSIGEMCLYPDGSFTIVGQKSDLTSMIKLSQELAAKIPVK